MIGYPVLVFADYGLARAFDLSGDANKAREQYRDFLARWTDVPILQQAKTEPAKIH